MFMIETMRRNFEGYTKQEVEDAIAVRQLQGMIGNSSDKTSLQWYVPKQFQTVLSPSMIANVQLKSLAEISQM